MNRLGFPLLVSTGLVLGMLLAPQSEKTPVRVDTGQPAVMPVLRPSDEAAQDVVARVVEAFLVDAQGTERGIVTRVSLKADERAGELPWRVRAELERSRELLGWAARVEVEASDVSWPDAPVSGRWQDASGRAVLVCVHARDGEAPAALIGRYAAALEALRHAAQPGGLEGLRSSLRAARERAEAPGEELPGAGATRAEHASGGWLVAASSRDEHALAAALPRADAFRQWLDLDGIEHRVRFEVGSTDEESMALLDELLARYPARVDED